MENGGMYNSSTKERAFELLKTNNLQDARILLNQVTQTNPDDVQTWGVLGALNETLGNLEEAEKCFRQVITLDPKNVEFTSYQDIKQLMYPIVNYAEDAYTVLSNLTDEMDNRFKIMAKASVKDIYKFNIKNPQKPMPYIVLIIDEFSDLMSMSKKVFQAQLSRLAQKSRACGIHIIIATQRPSADIVTGIVKANFPSRISCKVTSAINSRVILDRNGAEKLLGKGDALIVSSDHDLVRFKGAFVKQEIIDRICYNNKRGKIARFINYMRNF